MEIPIPTTNTRKKAVAKGKETTSGTREKLDCCSLRCTRPLRRLSTRAQLPPYCRTTHSCQVVCPRIGANHWARTTSATGMSTCISVTGPPAAGVRARLPARWGGRSGVVTVVSPHRPAGCFRGSTCDEQGEEGTECAHPRDWPARCGYEVRELDRHDGEVYSRSRSASSTRTRVPGPTCTQLRVTIARPDYKCEEEDGEYVKSVGGRH
ncbi:hypothetical protein B0H13DRAFT_1026270 [Mycena leptocephala]|nr:hypothetical protein B0H13DRAFT_1026270 [Mycena leptocephala]